MTDTQAVAAESQPVPTSLAAALEYAELGWRVMPLHAPVDTGCSCGQRNCRNVGKHPRIKDWRDVATNDFEQIEEWFGRWPEANIGLVTGEYFDVIDIDGQPGVNSIGTLLSGADKARMRDTYHVRTGNQESSWHYYVTPTGLRQGARLLPGVDLRSVGGLIVAPPSRHVSGRRYVPVASSSLTRILAAPGSLLEAIEAAQAPRPVLRPVSSTQTTRAAQRPTSAAASSKRITNPEAYTKTTTERIVADLASAPAHTGNDSLNKAAFRMFHFVVAGLLSADEATSMLMSAMAQRGRPVEDREVIATIRSGAAAAAARPDFDLIEAAQQARSTPAVSAKPASPAPASNEAVAAPEATASETPQVTAPAADTMAVAETPTPAVVAASEVPAPHAVEAVIGATPAPVTEEAAKPARSPQRRPVSQPKSAWASELDRIFTPVPDSTVRPYDLVLDILTLCAADLAATGMSPDAAASRMLGALEAQSEPWSRLMANATALARGAPPAGGAEVLRYAVTCKIREAVVGTGDATAHFDAASDRLSGLATLRPANLGRPELAASLAALAGTSDVRLAPAPNAAPIFVIAPSFARTPTAVFETVAHATGFSADLEFAMFELHLEQKGVHQRFLDAVQEHTGDDWATCVRTLSHTQCSDVMTEAMRSFDPTFPRVRKPLTFTPEQRERVSYTLANQMLATLDTPRPVAIEWSAGSDADQQATRERAKRCGLVVDEAVRVPVPTVDATGETVEIEVLYAPELPPGFVASVGGHATPEAKTMADRLYAAVTAAGLPWPRGAIEARIPAVDNLQLADFDVAVAGGFLAATGAWDNPHAPLVGRCGTDATVVLPDGQETALLEALAGQSLVEELEADERLVEELTADETGRKASNAYRQSEDYRYVTGLFAQLRGGDEQEAKQAQTALVRRLEPIIGTVLKKHNLSPQNQDYPDARQAAYEASLGVIDRFNPETGVRLTSYAYRRLDGAVLNYLSRDRGDLWQSYERKDRRIPAKSLDAATADAHDGDGLTLEEQLAAPTADPADEAAGRLASPLLARLMSACTEDERTILELRNGLDGNEPLTYSQIAKRLDTSPEHVRNQEMHAVEKMRQQSSAVGVTERTGVAPPTVEDLAEATRRMRRQTQTSGAGKVSAQVAATLIVAQTRERYPSYIASLEDASEGGLVAQICQTVVRPRQVREAAEQAVTEQAVTEEVVEQRPATPPPPPPPAQAGPPSQVAWC